MTIDERIERLEFLNASYIEQRRKDWEEDRQRFRDLQSHIDAIWLRMERRDEEYRRETKERDESWDRRTQELRERDHVLDERVEKLVSAIGELIKRMPQPGATQ